MIAIGHQPQFFQLPRVFRAGGHEVNPCGVDGGVSQHVRQLGDVPADLIEQRGEQMPEVVGENLGGLHPGFGAQRFHFPPDLAAGDRLSASGEKNLSGGGFLFPGVFQQLPAELGREEDGADFAFQADLRPPALHGPPR